MSPSVTAVLSELAERGRQPSLSGAAAQAGRRLWSDAIGDADPLGPRRHPGPATRYRIGSITKPQVAIAVVALAEAGGIDLDRPVSTWVPDAPATTATVRQFLCHTSGVPAEPPGPWWERAGSRPWGDLGLSDLPRLAPPGTRFHYSNVGYAVLGRLLEAVTGQPWDAALAEIVWRPLGMDDTSRYPGTDHATGVSVHPHADLLHPEPVADYHAMGPAGELWSTPGDLLRLGQFLAGVGEGAGILSPAALATLRTPIAFADVEGEPWLSGYGLGVAVGNVAGQRSFGHSGSVPGFTARLTVEVDTGVVVAVCGNATARFGDLGPLVDRLGDLLPEPAPEPTEAPTLAVVDLVGTWYWGPNEHTLTALSADRIELVGALAGAERHRFARAERSWVGESGGYFHAETLRPIRDRVGRVRQLDVGTFCFTRTPYDSRADLPGGEPDHRWMPRRR